MLATLVLQLILANQHAFNMHQA